MSFAISTYLETIRRTPGNLQNFKRYSHSFHFKASSCISERSNNVQFCNKTISTNDSSDKANAQGSDSRGSRSVTQLPVYSFSNFESGRFLPPNLQLKKTERVCTYPGLSTVQPLSSAYISSTQRLDGKVGFVPGLFSPAHTSTAPQVSQGELQRYPLPDDVSTFWTVSSSRYFRFGHELDSRTSQEPQDSLRSVPGRLSSGQSILRAATTTGQNYNYYTRATRMDGQLQEICSGSDTTPRVSRRDLGYTTQLQIPVGTKVPNAPQCTTRTERQLVPQTGPVPNGATQLCLICRPKGKAPLSDATILQQTVAKIPTPQTNHDTGTSLSRDELVGDDGFQFNSYTFGTHHTSPNYGRFRCGLGSTTWTGSSIRSVDNTTTELARKLQRTVCGLPSSSTRTAAAAECPHSTPDRQSHGRGIYKQGGWHEIKEIVRTNQTTAGTARLSKRNFNSSVLPRAIQCRSRRAVTQEDKSRMAPTAKGHDTAFPALGRTRSRSVCINNSSRSGTVCINGSTRRRGSISQRVSPLLGLQASLALPSTQPYAPSTESPQQGARQVCTDSSEMGEGVLASRSTAQSHSKSTSDTEPTSGINRHENGTTSPRGSQHVLGGLADTRWADIIKDWTDQEKSLLLASWRPSTIRTYVPAWKKWTRWCSSNSVDFKCPNPTEVARYLAHLHIHEGLAYRTILVHKSAISTFTKINKCDVSSNFLVKQILKAISVEKIRPSKPPIWDPRSVITFLSNKDIDENNLYQVSQRVAVLLLLASSRRVHDLTLLKIGPEHLIDEGKSIIMWPSFGSKTDSLDRRQSGWKIKEHPDKNLNTVYWIRILLQVSQERRSEEKWLELFITTRGQCKPATKTIIGGWIKAVLRDAGIEASPGSVRSAVSSLNWLENFSIDNILATGNWKREHTFKNYYCRPLANNSANSSNIVSLSRFFEAV